MAYGLQAVLPTELQYWFPRFQAYQPVEAKQARQDSIDSLEESRDITVARSVMYQQTLQQYHTQRVHPRAI
jgi:hypothetical protein